MGACSSKSSNKNGHVYDGSKKGQTIHSQHHNYEMPKTEEERKNCVIKSVDVLKNLKKS